MARIRTIKPEAFASESLAAVSLSAERTFFGLLTQVDDRGRIRDQPAVIAGVLWSLRPEHGPMGVEDDLIQLAAEDLICRYTGDDGKAYLHVVTWSQHQRINRPSGVRTPGCPRHDAPRAEPASATTTAHARLTEPSMRTPGARTPDSRNMADARPLDREPAGQLPFPGGSVRTHDTLTEPSVSPHAPDLGPRNLDPGTTSPTGDASVPAQPTTSAQKLIAEYAAACAHRPPRDVLGHLGRETAKLLTEGVDPDHIRAGLTRHRAKGLHPSTLPSLVHEAMNAAPAGFARPGSTPNLAAHRPWANPANPAAAYAEEL
ncbi:hypothetical protein [Streptomyces sp. Da 82-17]|uniref:hypothetical protein n=1 Tax=Streptomyces sp. Da 82-17 TaxID=3377116 RepID=UPI0038D4DAD1